MLKVSSLLVKVPGKTILKDISFIVEKSRVVTLIGPNGAGKTSLLRTVAGLLPQAAGKVYIKETLRSDLGRKQLAQTMAVVRQTIEAPAMTVKNYVALGRLPYFQGFQFYETLEDKKIIADAMEEAGVTHLKDKRMDRISGGERQLASVSKALAQQPELLLLDEPTAHLDITHQARILKLVHRLSREKGLAVLMVLHDLNLAAQFSDHLILISKQTGQIHAAGPPEEVITQQAVEAVYRTGICLGSHPQTGTPQIFVDGNDF